MYTFDSKVRYSEIDQEGFLKPVSLIQYMQDCSCFQAESLDDGIEQTRKTGVAWVLTFWQIVIDSYPKYRQPITIGTQAWGFNSLMGLRNFAIMDEAGLYQVKANSMWVMMDLKKGHPVKIIEDVAKKYSVGERLEMDYCERKIRLPENMEQREPVEIRFHHIDTNQHVNNVAYMEIALEVLKQPIRPKEIRIEYKMQAKLGSYMYPRIGFDGTFYVISLENEKGRAYAVVALKA